MTAHRNRTLGGQLALAMWLLGSVTSPTAAQPASEKKPAAQPASEKKPAAQPASERKPAAQPATQAGTAAEGEPAAGAAAEVQPAAATPDQAAPDRVAPTQAQAQDGAAAAAATPGPITTATEPSPTGPAAPAPAGTPGTAVPPPARTRGIHRHRHAHGGASATPAAPPGLGKSALSLQWVGRVQGDSSYDLVADDDLRSEWGVAIARDVWSPTEDLVVAPTLAFARGRSDTWLRDTLDSSFDTWDLLAGAQLRYAALPWLAPHARVLLGASRAKLVIDAPSDGGNQNLSQAGWSMAGRIGAGVGLYLPRKGETGDRGLRRRVSFGIELEVGMALHPAFDVELGSSQLGSLKRTAPYGAVSLVLRR